MHLRHQRYIYCPNTNTLYNKEIKDTYLEHVENRRVHFEDIPLDRDSIKANIGKTRQIIFEASQGCGMACRYCIYNDNIYRFTRKPGPLNIDFHTAQKAIDLLYTYIGHREKKELSVGFYGGEPLINFKEIKRIVEYSKSKFKDWNLIFTITTNATMLDEENMQFLIENRFKTLISLDGPRENHDAKRVYADGSGTFDDVVKNLERLKELNPAYYKEYIHFSIVYSKDLSLRSLFDFFNTNGLVNQNHSNLGYITEANSSYYDHYKYDVRTLRKERKGIFADILKKAKAKIELSSIETNFTVDLAILKKNLDTRKFNILSGACCFDERLFISADGKFHICEKINDTFSFGDVETGFDFSQMADIAREYVDIIKTNCLDCEIRFLCMRCYANFTKNSYFELDRTFCENNAYTVRKMLEELIRLEEAGYSP